MIIPDEVREIIGEAVSGRIGQTFRCMSIAEEEIKDAKRRWPRRARRLNAAFGILMPGDLVTAGDRLYRAHCQELLGRVMRGEDIVPGTDAECMFVLMRASLAAPPDGDHARAYGRLFAACFPDHADITKGLGRESYEGRVDEIIAHLREKIGKTVNREQYRKAA